MSEKLRKKIEDSFNDWERNQEVWDFSDPDDKGFAQMVFFQGYLRGRMAMAHEEMARLEFMIEHRARVIEYPNGFALVYGGDYEDWQSGNFATPRMAINAAMDQKAQKSA